MAAVHPVILSGGSGTRLWPLSRAMYPKQFIRSFNDRSSSFLALALERLSPPQGFEAPTLLCNTDHRFLVKDELERAKITPRAIILEPVARNTAAAIAVAALSISRDDASAILVVMPADHVIENEKAFIDAVRHATKVAESGRLVLFGIQPNKPYTGYGYIRKGPALEGSSVGAFQVAAFTEKPDAGTAKRYLAAGDYFWNSGIFVLHARTFLEELGRLEPNILDAARGGLAGAVDDLGCIRLDRSAFGRSPNVSIDYAVMEKTDAAAMLPMDVGWSDVGSWSSLWEIAERDASDNYIQGDAVLEDTKGCYLRGDRRLIATIGLRNLIIVDTPDALLVVDRLRSQEVSRIAARLKESNRREQEQHLRNHRPWGYFETLSTGACFQVKLLHVKPGGKLSMQMHHHRSEHWVVVQGSAKILVGDTEKLIHPNESVYIFATQWHRLENPGTDPLEIIEVQFGAYLGEDDIVRGDDAYHRSAEETK